MVENVWNEHWYILFRMLYNQFDTHNFMPAHTQHVCNKCKAVALRWLVILAKNQIIKLLYFIKSKLRCFVVNCIINICVKYLFRFNWRACLNYLIGRMLNHLISKKNQTCTGWPRAPQMGRITFKRVSWNPKHCFSVLFTLSTTFQALVTLSFSDFCDKYWEQSYCK